MIHNCDLLEMIKNCVVDSLIKGDDIYKGKMPLIKKIPVTYFMEIPNLIKEKMVKFNPNKRTYEEIINSFEKLVILTQSPSYILWFAQKVRGYSTFELEEAIIDTYDARHIYLYARDIKKGTIIRKLESAIISTKDAQHIYLFSKYVKESLKEVLFMGLLQTGNLRYISEFLNDLDLEGKEAYEYLYKGITAFEV